MFRLLDKVAGKWLDWRVRSNAAYLDMRVEEAHLTTAPDGTSLTEVTASFRPVADMLSRCSQLLNHYDAKNFLVFRMLPRPDHATRPVEITLRWADTGRNPGEVVILLSEAMKGAVDFGHNDDCLFCGFKDKRIIDALAEVGHAVATKSD